MLMLLDEPVNVPATEMVSEALNTMAALGRDGMTMMVGLYEMGFAHTVMHRVVFMNAGEAARDAFFEGAASARVRLFLSETILKH